MPLRIQESPRTQPNTTDGRSRTRTHLSTNIYIATSDPNNGSPYIVGAVKQLTVNETRQITKIPEVGTDGIIDSAPQSSADFKGSCERTRFDGRRVAHAFRRGFIHIHSQREPFDIQVYDIIEGDSGNSVIITTIKNVWIESLSYSYQADNFVIVDTMGWTAETMFSVRRGPSSNVVTEDRTNFNPFEKQADRGQFRGALDGAGLINSFDGGGI